LLFSLIIGNGHCAIEDFCGKVVVDFVWESGCCWRRCRQIGQIDASWHGMKDIDPDSRSWEYALMYGGDDLREKVALNGRVGKCMGHDRHLSGGAPCGVYVVYWA
jgi:hypothetical protein